MSYIDTDPKRWCQCEKCKAMEGTGGLAQRMVTFVNRIATAAEKKHPGHFFPHHVVYYLPGSPVANDATFGSVIIRRRFRFS